MSIAGLVRDALGRGEFSAAAWSVGGPSGVVEQGALGTVSAGGPDAGEDTWFDLASVTKPIVGLAVLALVERGALVLDDTVGRWRPDFRGTDKEALTVRQLLRHTSGIPGQVPMYRWAHTPDELIELIRHVPVACSPDTTVIYSSQGFILLGLIASAAAGAPLDELVSSLVLEPAGMTGTRWGLPPELRARAAATEDCPWRGRIVQGTVHDENCEVLGGVAGHAGLFAPIADLAALGRALASGGGGVLSPAGLAAMTAPATDHLNLRRALAWQGVDDADSPAGDLIGPLGYGHTGFTGTSLWIDPARARYVALLTNRVHPTRADRGFTRTRRAVHNTAFAHP